jgi:hypothetical protein
MIVLATALAGAWAMMTLAPSTPIGRSLHAALVEAPARRLAAVRRATVIAMLLTIALTTAAWAIDYELLQLAAMAAPEAAIWLSMVEVGTLVEVGAAAFAARTVFRTDALRAILPRPRGTRARRPARSLPANDDEDHRAAA